MKISKYLDGRPGDREWLGNIPTHWEVRRLKFQINKVGSGVTPSGGAESYELEGIPLLRSQNVHFDGLRLDDVVFITVETHDSMANSKVQPKDVLLNITGASIGRCCLVPGDIGEANVNQHVAIIRSDSSIDPGFLAFLLRANPGQKQIELSQTGSGREGLTFEAIRNFVVPLPGITEQQQIAAFLDWKTGQIDAVMARKKELLEKLKEKRLALITQAVTRGLNPAAPLRDSGVPWLGNVPKHWEVKRLRYCAGLVTSGSRGWAQFFTDSGNLFLRITNLDRESIELKLDDLQRVDPPEGAEGARTLTTAGDLLISITADLGSVAVVPENLEPAYVSQHLSLVRLDTADIDPVWIGYAIFSHSGKSQLLTAGYGGTKMQLSLGDIKEIVFCHPPTRHEQQAVLNSIRFETERIDHLIALTSSAIARLTEYRTAFITAATTGKIDVRGVKIPHPAA